MMLKNKFLLAFYISITSSCGLKAQNIALCEENYRKGELQNCYNCSKEYLASNPTDLKAMVFIAKCAQSQDELAFVYQYMKTHFEEHKENPDFWITYGDLLMKSGDSVRANERYSVANYINSPKEPTTTVIMGRNDTSILHPNNYQLALTRWEHYKNVEGVGRYISKKQWIVVLNEIVNYLKRELVNNPDDSASLALKKEVDAILYELR